MHIAHVHPCGNCATSTVNNDNNNVEIILNALVFEIRENIHDNLITLQCFSNDFSMLIVAETRRTDAEN